jgi:hypothetical protein
VIAVTSTSPIVSDSMRALRDCFAASFAVQLSRAGLWGRHRSQCQLCRLLALGERRKAQLAIHRRAPA